MLSNWPEHGDHRRRALQRGEGHDGREVNAAWLLLALILGLAGIGAWLIFGA